MDNGQEEARAQLLGALRHVHGLGEPARRRLRERLAVRAGLAAFFGVSLVYALWRGCVFCVAMPGPLVSTWEAGSWALGMGLLGFGAARLRPSLRRDLRDLAECWDVALRSQNRLATALELTGRPEGPFEAAAIADGLRLLETVQEAGPFPEDPVSTPLGDRDLSVLLSGCVLLAAAAIMPVRGVGASDDHPPSLLPPGRTVVAFPLAPDALASPAASRPHDPAPKPPQGVSPHTGEVRDAAATSGSVSSSPARARERVPAAGSPGQGKSVHAQEARQSVSSMGDSTHGAPASPTTEDPLVRGAARKKARDPAPVVSNNPQARQEVGATVGQSGSGSGSMSPVKSPWTQRDRSFDEPLPENPSDEAVEGELSVEDARGGTRPTLKDRRSSPSRDLSLSGPGDGGDGRGGPTPQKKSRGTASLVLGVPVPDFVRGLLNPGTTKVTHERVDPVRSETRPSSPSRVAPRTSPEPLVEAFRVPDRLSASLRRFFLTYHGTPGESGGPPRD